MFLKDGLYDKLARQVHSEKVLLYVYAYFQMEKTDLTTQRKVPLIEITEIGDNVKKKIMEEPYLRLVNTKSGFFTIDSLKDRISESKSKQLEFGSKKSEYQNKFMKALQTGIMSDK